VTITRKGFLARATSGKGKKRIPIHDLTAVHLKPAGSVVNGCIQFTIAGGSEERSRLGRQTTPAAENEHSVMFTRRQAAAFEALCDATEKAIAARHPGQADAFAAAVLDRTASDTEATATTEFVRTGTDRRSGSDRREGTERRGPQNPIVERIGAATERRDNDGNRRSEEERRSGEDRRDVAADPATTPEL
jgi:hypothetical protein